MEFFYYICVILGDSCIIKVHHGTLLMAAITKRHPTQKLLSRAIGRGVVFFRQVIHVKIDPLLSCGNKVNSELSLH